MATVNGYTAEHTEEVFDESIVDGEVVGDDLILTTRGGTPINAGDVRGPIGITPVAGVNWGSGVPYVTNDIVGYQGRMWRATGSSTNKVPSMNTSLWVPLTGIDVDAWYQTDPYFTSDSFGVAWETFWKSGTSTVSLTTTAGEFETGKQALKVALSASSTQSLYEKDENIVYGGEPVTMIVRAKLTAAAAGATMSGEILQNDMSGPPGILESGVVATAAIQSAYTLSTTWTDYYFTFYPANAKPRARVHLKVLQAAGNSSNIVIDRVLIMKKENTGWMPLLPITGWAAYGAGFVTPRIKLEDKWVELDGLIQRTGANLVAAATLFNVAARFRPTAGIKSKWVDNSGTLVRVDIPTSGNLFFPTAGINTNGFIFLDLLRWPVD